ncbi:LuxR family transcriptional regulator [Azospirillum sp. TSO22-1]|uniref:helix-turn-helix transcriptional regulator n=1 Tax=Azospirillum sp. TSO22-1 TaxID=716789 RepID=UPI000D651A73|nr:LuxR family transcriptional regulator [Azospirillum sp. TSO22-1]
MSAYQRYLKEIASARHLEGLQEIMRSTLSELCIESYAYLSVGIGANGVRSPFLIGNYDSDWTEYYIRNKLDMIDPVIETSIKSCLPFFWGVPEVVYASRPEQEVLFRQAASFGIRHGWTVPIHDCNGRIGTINICSSKEFVQFKEHIENLEMMLHVMSIHFHASVRKGELANTKRSSIDLTIREKQCLEWAAKGKSRTDIAEIIGLSPRTVKFHIENAQKKFGVFSTRQAALQAALAGLISI